MDELLSAIKQAFAWLKNLVHRIIRGVISFMGHVVSWFRGLNLNPQRHTPFIGNAQKEEFKKLLKAARVEDVGIFTRVEDVGTFTHVEDVGIFKGVYDEQTGEIIHAELLSGDALDTQTKNILQNDALVVLS